MLVIVLAVIYFVWFTYQKQKGEELVTYTNTELGFSFQYPRKLGEVVDEGPNNRTQIAYIFNKDEKTYLGKHRTYIYIYDDETVKKWNEYVINSESDSVPLRWPVAVKTLLEDKGIGYDCTSDFIYLQKKYDDTCKIVNVNNVKVFEIISWGGSQSEVSVLMYRFYVSNRWYEFIKNFDLSDENGKLTYNSSQMNLFIQGKTHNSEIQKEVDGFNKIIYSLKFF